MRGTIHPARRTHRMTDEQQPAANDTTDPAEDLAALAKRINTRERRSRKARLRHAEDQGNDIVAAIKRCKEEKVNIDAWREDNIDTMCRSRFYQYKAYAEWLERRCSGQGQLGCPESGQAQPPTEEDKWAAWQRCSGKPPKGQDGQNAWQAALVSPENAPPPFLSFMKPET